MKANMKADGTIVLEPESGIEAFALKRWSEGQFIDSYKCVRGKFIVDFSIYPDALKSSWGKE